MKQVPRVKKGDPITADWGNRLEAADAVRRQVPWSMSGATGRLARNMARPTTGYDDLVAFVCDEDTPAYALMMVDVYKHCDGPPLHQSTPADGTPSNPIYTCRCKYGQYGNSDLLSDGITPRYPDRYYYDHTKYHAGYRWPRLISQQEETLTAGDVGWASFAIARHNIGATPTVAVYGIGEKAGEFLQTPYTPHYDLAFTFGGVGNFRGSYCAATDLVEPFFQVVEHPWVTGLAQVDVEASHVWFNLYNVTSIFGPNVSRGSEIVRCYNTYADQITAAQPVHAIYDHYIEGFQVAGLGHKFVS